MAKSQSPPVQRFTSLFTHTNIQFHAIAHVRRLQYLVFLKRLILDDGERGISFHFFGVQTPIGFHNQNGYAVNPLVGFCWRASLLPAAMEIPACFAGWFP